MTQTSKAKPTRLVTLLLVVTVLLALGLLLAFKINRNPSSAYTNMAKGESVKQLTSSEGTLAYTDSGTGPLIVLVPGLGDLREEYRFLAPELVGAGYRVVTLDLRGHGGSSPHWPSYSPQAVGGDILNLIHTINAGPAIVVGTSFAAASAVWAAAEGPEEVAGIVLVGPFVRDGETSLLQRIAMKVMFAGPWKVRAWDWYYGTLYPTSKPADFAAYRAALRANLAQPGRFEALKAMMSENRADIVKRLPEVKAPTLILMGTKDPDFGSPKEEADWVATNLRGEAVMIEGAGHYPHAEMPHVTAPVILDFLAEVDVLARVRVSR